MPQPKSIDFLHYEPQNASDGKQFCSALRLNMRRISLIGCRTTPNSCRRTDRMHFSLSLYTVHPL